MVLLSNSPGGTSAGVGVSACASVSISAGTSVDAGVNTTLVLRLSSRLAPKDRERRDTVDHKGSTGLGV